jgi:hypothetical protein
VAIKTYEFGKRRYVAMKDLNQGKALCGNTNIQTVKKGLCEYGEIYCRAVQGSEYGKRFGVAVKCSEKWKIAM